MFVRPYLLGLQDAHESVVQCCRGCQAELPRGSTFSCMDVFLLLKRERMFIAALRCLSVLLTDLGGSAELAH